jgi:hypothetical protein
MEEDDRQCFLTDEESEAMVFIPPLLMLMIPRISNLARKV